MNRQSAIVEMKAGNPVSDSERGEKANVDILIRGHSGVMMDPGSTMETCTSYMATYVSPKSPDVRLCDTRREHTAKRIAQEFREKIQNKQKDPVPKIEFCSMTQRDFSVQIFVPEATQLTVNTDYKTDHAITFWNQNCQRIQGVTAVQNPREPFKKSSIFSKPISQRMDEIHPQYN